MINLGLNNVSKIYSGLSEVTKIYAGDIEVWSSGSGPTPPTPIPSQYIQLDYIRSVGSSVTNLTYINTGFRPTNDTVLEYKITLPSDRATYFKWEGALLYGAMTWTNASTQSGGALSFGHIFWNSIAAGHPGGWLFMGSRIGEHNSYYLHTGMPFTIYDGQKHVIEGRHSTSLFEITTDGTYHSYTPNDGPWSGLDGTANTISELLLFSGYWSNASTPDSFVTQEMNYFKIYDNNVLVRDYVPVYDTVTQKYGLYDKVNSTFNISPNNIDFTGPAWYVDYSSQLNGGWGQHQMYSNTSTSLSGTYWFGAWSSDGSNVTSQYTWTISGDITLVNTEYYDNTDPTSRVLNYMYTLGGGAATLTLSNAGVTLMTITFN